MSFGFSVGDFLAVSQLTWTLYRSCKGAPGEFEELSRELNSLHTILLELEDEARSPTSLLNRRGTARKSELDTLLNNLSSVLRQIEDIAKRYNSLGKDQKKTWDRVKFAAEDLTDLRGKLSFHVNSIQLIIASLSAGSLARIEGILDELVQDIKTGRKEPTVISTNEDDEEVAWSELERELIGDGITKQIVENYKEDIKEYLEKLLQENLGGAESCSNNTISNDAPHARSKNKAPDAAPEDIISETDSPKPKQENSIGAEYGLSNSLTFNPIVEARALKPPSPQSSESAHVHSKQSMQRDIRVIKPQIRLGLLGVSATSTKPLLFLCAEIVKRLRQKGIRFDEIRNGFSCHYEFRVEIRGRANLWVPYRAGKQDNMSLASTNGRDLASSSQTARLSDSEENSIGVDGMTLPTNRLPTAETVLQGPITTLTFEILIVKVPWITGHGIKFELLKGDEWHFRHAVDGFIHDLVII